MKNINTYEIVEVFYAENERQYRVVQKKPNGQIQDVARLTSREKAQYYIDARTQQEAPEEVNKLILRFLKQVS